WCRDALHLGLGPADDAIVFRLAELRQHPCEPPRLRCTSANFLIAIRLFWRLWPFGQPPGRWCFTQHRPASFPVVSLPRSSSRIIPSPVHGVHAISPLGA